MRAGKVVKIPPKEEALLRLLLRNADQVVTHEVIERELWPRQNISYLSVSRCVYSLRGILGGQREEYIETIPKRGYRFVKPVISADGEVPTSVFARMGHISPLAYSHFIEGSYHVAVSLAVYTDIYSCYVHRTLMSRPE